MEWTDQKVKVISKQSALYLFWGKNTLKMRDSGDFLKRDLLEDIDKKNFMILFIHEKQKERTIVTEKDNKVRDKKISKMLVEHKIS